MGSDNEADDVGVEPLAGEVGGHTYTIERADVDTITRLLTDVFALPAKDYLHFMRHLLFFHGAMSEPSRPADRRSR